MSLKRQSRRASSLVSDTGSASAAVIVMRLAAMSVPGALGSARQEGEMRRMVSDKVEAGYQGGWAAAMQMAFLPARAMAAFATPAALTPAGYVKACGKVGALWLGVGNAALAPSRHKAVGNRKRLAGAAARRR